MEDKTIDEKMKDIEREIDSAIDKLFVDKTSDVKPDFETFEPHEEVALEEEMREPGAEHEKKVEKGEEVAEKTKETPGLPDNLLKAVQELETLKSRVEKFLEWGVTTKALENVSNVIQKVEKDFIEQKLIGSVTRMVSDVLNFLKENPSSHLNEMVDFLSNALSSMQNLIKSEEDKDIDPEEVFSAINAQFSSISSMLTFDIPKIELEERFFMPAEEIGKGEIEEKRSEAEVPPKEEEKEPTSEILTGKEQGEGKIPKKEMDLDMAFVDLEQPLSESTSGEAARKEIEPAEEKTVKLKEREETGGGEEPEKEEVEFGGEEEEVVDLEEIAVPFAGTSVETVKKYKTFSEIVQEFSSALKNVENTFFRDNSILDLTGKLSTQVEALSDLTSTLSLDSFSETDLKQLQKSVEEIQRDVNVLSGLLGVKEHLISQEIVPVIVGRKMIGLISQAVKNIYSVSNEQLMRIRQRGALSIKGEEIPFHDLLKEFGEPSDGANLRIVIVETSKGKKAILANRVMKRRFALVSGSEEDVQKSAKFYFAEEIPVYADY